MGQYHTKGLYNTYKKNNKERDALDYYATPPEEVTNILNVLDLDLSCSYILEPCSGGGHMIKGILDYIKSKPHSREFWRVIATDIKDRESIVDSLDYQNGGTWDFLADDYPYNEDIEYVIMNPPYATIEPFVIRGLEIAQKGLLVLGRLQFLEGKGRYEAILKDNPPTDTYVYVDRIKCYKNGDFSNAESSAQAYAWFYWDKTKADKTPTLHWIRRAN